MSDLFFGAFTVTRRYDAQPARVFAAFADREEGTATGLDQLNAWLALQQKAA